MGWLYRYTGKPIREGGHFISEVVRPLVPNHQDGDSALNIRPIAQVGRWLLPSGSLALASGALRGWYVCDTREPDATA